MNNAVAQAETRLRRFHQLGQETARLRQELVVQVVQRAESRKRPTRWASGLQGGSCPALAVVLVTEHLSAAEIGEATSAMCLQDPIRLAEGVPK